MPTQNKKVKRSGLEIPKVYQYIGKGLQWISEDLTVKYAIRLFFTPIKFRMPERELPMDRESRQSKLLVPSINKTINIYEYGEGEKKILLVHGWNGRGTQMVTLANFLIKEGYAIVSFDAPGHGKSSGSQTNMTEIVSCVQEVNKKMGDFEGIIGHSMGAMSSINAIRLGVKTKFLVCLGSGDIIRDIIDDFIQKLGVKPKIGDRIQQKLDDMLGYSVHTYSASVAVQELDLPILLIHDEEDTDVPVESARNIHKNAKNSQLLITKGYGHRKIMACDEVLQTINKFIKKHDK